eukprot:GILI01019743.1.p1 GENE.GILI01019743.1~~GILI01019743.1.p1  ORF type:complete len:253 (-),score=41.04 GILI01019743.1:2-760(-)
MQFITKIHSNIMRSLLRLMQYPPPTGRPLLTQDPIELTPNLTQSQVQVTPAPKSPSRDSIHSFSEDATQPASTPLTQDPTQSQRRIRVTSQVEVVPAKRGSVVDVDEGSSDDPLMVDEDLLMIDEDPLGVDDEEPLGVEDPSDEEPICSDEEEEDATEDATEAEGESEKSDSTDDDGSQEEGIKKKRRPRIKKSRACAIQEAILAERVERILAGENVLSIDAEAAKIYEAMKTAMMKLKERESHRKCPCPLR